MTPEQEAAKIMGRMGGNARNAKLSKKRKKEIASQGGKALWARIKKGNL